MNVVVKTNAFLESLQAMVISQKLLIPILANVLLRANIMEGEVGLEPTPTLTVISTDLDISVECKIAVDIIEEGSITLPFKKLLDIVREMPGEDISIKVNEDYYTIIASGKSFFYISGLPEDDYPNIPSITGDKYFSILSSVFKRMIRKVAFSVAVDDSRQTLNGGCLSVEGAEVKIIATDGYIFSYAKHILSSPVNQNMCVIIPNKTLNEIMKVLKEESIVDVYLKNNQIMLNFDDIVFTARLLDGSFPDYKNFLPNITQDNVLHINRNTLLNTCRRVSIMNTVDVDVFNICISDNTIEVTTIAPGMGEAKENITDIDYKGENFSVKYKSKHTINVLKNIDIEEIDMFFVSELKAGVINIKTKTEEYFYFIVPIIER